MKFSALICVYINDDPVHFEAALDSIIDQTLIPDEIVLVIDGPVGDETLSVITRKSSSFGALKVIRLEENVGHGRARQIGIEHCTNELVALMDSDDVSVSERFEEQIACFAGNSELSVVGGWISEFSVNVMNPIGTRRLPSEDADIKRYLKYRCPMNQVTVMFKKSDVERAGGYLDWHHEEDYYLWLRMHLWNCKFQNINRVLVHVRADEKYFSRRGGIKYFLSEARLQKYMLLSGIINALQFSMNVVVRFLVQVIMPNSIRRAFFIMLRRNV